MPYSYPSEFRQMVIERVRDGVPVSAVASELDVPAGTVSRWVRQDKIDRGELAGTPTVESAELRAAKRRIAELENELAIVKKASELFDERRVVRPKVLHPVVEELSAVGYSAKRCCRILGIAPSGFFRWRHRVPTRRELRRVRLTDRILQIHHASHQTYGVRRIGAELLDVDSERVNRKLIKSIMREQQIQGLPRRRKGRKNLINRQTTVDLVNRDFVREGPNQLWMTDITEHPTREGRLYCCAVIDAWSRKVVGWSIDQQPTAAMVNSALGMAIDARKPKPGSLIHSDHGSQYTSWSFSQRVRAAGLAHSLGTIGDAYDNAVVEAFWARMQTELLNRRKWRTRVELANAIFEYIEVFYNRTRRHSTLGMLSPSQYEKRNNAA